MRLVLIERKKALVSESLRLFLHRHSDIIICRPLFAQWHPLRMITFADWKDASFLYEMLNGIKVILAVELQAQKQPGVDILESFSASYLYL